MDDFEKDGSMLLVSVLIFFCDLVVLMYMCKEIFEIIGAGSRTTETSHGGWPVLDVLFCLFLFSSVLFSSAFHGQLENSLQNNIRGRSRWKYSNLHSGGWLRTCL